MKNAILILLIATLIASCKKEATVWETDWSAPIVNDTLTMTDLVNDTTLIESSGFYELDLTRTLFNLDINSVAEIPDTTIHAELDNGTWANFPVNAGTSIFQTPDVQERDLVLEDIQLTKIIMRKGQIQMRFENPLPTKVFFYLKMPGFKKDGIEFDNVYEIPAGTVANPGIMNQSIDLSQFHIDLTGLSGYDFNKFVTEIDVIAESSVNFGDEHIVVVDATFKDIELDYARGYFGSKVISEVVDVDLEALDIYESGSIDLSTLSLSFDIENGIKVGAQGILNSVSNENALGTTVSLTGGSIGNAFNIDPATGNWNTLTPSLNSLQFTSSNSNIENYLENLGTKHTIDYSLQINPWGNTSGGWDEIFPQSQLKVKLHAQMPLAIGLDNLILRDTFEVDLNQDPEKTRIVSGELVLDASNAFPFSADVTLVMLDANGNLLHTINGTELVEASQFGDYVAAYDFNVANSQVRFILSDEVVAGINDVTHIIVKSKFNSLNPSTMISEQMIIPVDAFLSVKLKTKFKSENRF